MAGDPYADFATPVSASPAASNAADPYADVASPVQPHELSMDERNQLLQDFIRKPNVKASDAMNYAAQLGLRITGHMKENVGNPGAHVVSEPPPPPDTSWGHDAAVAAKGVGYGLADAGDFATKTILGPISHIGELFGAPDPGKPAYDLLDNSNFGTPETSGQHFLQAGVRGVTAAAPFGAAGGARVIAGTLLSGASSALSGEAARQAGFGPKVQMAASLAGGVAAGGGVNALARPSLAALPEMAEGAVPPMPRGPIASFRRLTGSDTTTGAHLVAQRLADDGINPHDAGRVMAEAQANGTPLALADMGENTRALAGSVSRQPGPARTIGKQFTKERQMGQMDRVRDAINRDLGPTTDVLEESNNLQQQAKSAAAPLYEKAYAAPALQSPRLTSILNTPAAKAALKRAASIAANEGKDPNTLGVQFDAAGDPVLTPTPSTETLDYVKRGLDDIIEQNRSPLTGKLQLDEYGRSVNNVKNRLLSEMDRLNPDYASARQAYAGPAALRSAMMDGKAALNKSASEINQRIKNMTPAEADQYGLGLRSAIADAMERSPDGANKVRALVGDPRRRAVLQTVFGGKANLDRFVATMENEHAAFETYYTVHGGSPTQPRAMEDHANSDVNLVKGIGGDLAAVGGGHIGIGLRVLERGGDLLRFGAGKAGQRAREDAASLLFSTSSGEFKDALGKISLQARRNLYRRQGLFPVTGAAAAASQYGKDKP